MKLREADYNFADDVDKTLSAVGSAAKKAFTAFTGAKKKAEAGLKKDAEKAARVAAKQKKTDTQTSSIEPDPELRAVARDAKTQRIDIARFLVNLEELPKAKDLDAFSDLDASQFQDFIQELLAMEKELNDFPKQYRALLKSSQYLTAPQKGNESMDEISQPIDKPNAEESLAKSIKLNPNNLQTTLMSVLIDPSLSKSGKSVMNWLTVRSKYNDEANGEKPMTGNRSTGPDLARIFNAYVLQVLIPRLEAVIALAQDAENRPVTQESLKAIRQLLERL